MNKKAKLQRLTESLELAINENRKVPEARELVSEAILRLRQIRGMLELC